MCRGGRWVTVVAVLVLGAGATAGCGDASENRENEPGPTEEVVSPSAEEDTSAPEEETDASDATTGAPADPAAAEKEVTRNWERFFDPAVSQDEKTKVLEDGERLRPLLKAFNGDERGEQVRADVSKVDFTSAREADVAYALTLKGATALPDAQGTAVEQDGDWKVSVKTLCALVAMSGTDVPESSGC